MVDFWLSLRLFRCAYDIRVNDCPIIADQEGAGCVVRIHINSWIKSGENIVSLSVERGRRIGFLDEDSTASIEVIAEDGSVLGSDPLSLCKIEFPTKAPDSTPRLNHRSEKLDVSFFVSEEFPRWRWLDGLMLQDTKSTREQLLDQLTRFHGLLASRDIRGVMGAVRVRDLELSESCAIPLEVKVGRTEKMFQNLFDSSLFQLSNLYTENLKCLIYGNGRLARMEAIDGGSPLFYEGVTENVFARLPLIFYQPHPDNWVIIR